MRNLNLNSKHSCLSDNQINGWSVDFTILENFVRYFTVEIVIFLSYYVNIPINIYLSNRFQRPLNGLPLVGFSFLSATEIIRQELDLNKVIVFREWNFSNQPQWAEEPVKMCMLHFYFIYLFITCLLSKLSCHILVIFEINFGTWNSRRLCLKREIIQKEY